MRRPTKAELGWKRHRGGKCPVPLSTKIEVRYRNGLILTQEVNEITSKPRLWMHMEGSGVYDIMAYRILE